MKTVLCAMALMVCICIVVTPALAQQPTIKIIAGNCSGPGLDTLTVVLENLNEFLTGAEYKINYPPEMIFLADLDTPGSGGGPAGVTLGSSPNGISMGFAIPQNGFSPVVLQRVLVLYTPTNSSAPASEVCVVGHPLFNPVPQVTRFPDLLLIEVPGECAPASCRVADLDIKPESCPNPLNIKLFDPPEGGMSKKGGVLPVAILGTASFDVTAIDAGSVRLEGVAPLKQPKLEDVAAPAGGTQACACGTGGPDGLGDLKAKFSSQQIAAAIGGPVAQGEQKTVTLTGNLLDGTPFEATDCVVVVGKATPPPLPFNPVVGLNPAAPNPFNPVTRLSFFVDSPQRVHLAVYDVTGRLIDVLVDRTVESGEHSFQWEARGLASGVYFYRLKTAKESFTRRMILLK